MLSRHCLLALTILCGLLNGYSDLYWSRPERHSSKMGNNGLLHSLMSNLSNVYYTFALACTHVRYSKNKELYRQFHPCRLQQWCVALITIHALVFMKVIAGYTHFICLLFYMLYNYAPTAIRSAFLFGIVRSLYTYLNNCC